MNGQTYGQTDRQKDRQLDGQMDRQPVGCPGRFTKEFMDGRMDELTE